MSLKDKFTHILGIESRSSDADEQEFIYTPSDWTDRGPRTRIGASRVIRVGGGVRTCVFPVPQDERYMGSYIEYVANYAQERQILEEAMGNVALGEVL